MAFGRLGIAGSGKGQTLEVADVRGKVPVP